MATTDLQSILNNAMSQLNGMKLNAASTGSGGNNTASSTYINSIFSLAQQGQQAIDGQDEQKAHAIVGMVQNLISMLSIGENHQAKASADVNKNSNEITKTELDADKKAQEVKSRIEEITGDIANSTANINKAIEEIKKLGGSTEEIKEIKDQIQAQLDIIEQNKQDLNDPEKRETALSAISAASQVINDLVLKMGQAVVDMQGVIEQQNSVIEENVNNISNLITESAEKISDGVASLQQYIQKDSQAGAEASKLTAQGGVDVPTGNAEVTVGEGLNSNVFSALFSGGQGIKLVMDGNQRIGAGQTRISGGVSNLQKVVQGIGKMGSDISEISNFTNALGGVGNSAIELVGLYQSTLEPYIKSMGSYTEHIEALVSDNEALQAQVAAWQSGENTSNSPDEQKLSDKKEDTDVVGKLRNTVVQFGI